jgi:hypothetical protein
MYPAHVICRLLPAVVVSYVLALATAAVDSSEMPHGKFCLFSSSHASLRAHACTKDDAAFQRLLLLSEKHLVIFCIVIKIL